MTTIAFATDIHHDTRIFEWLAWARASRDVVAIGGDLDDPVRKLGDPFGFLMHVLMPSSVKDRILALPQVVTVLGNHDRPDPRALHGAAVTIKGITIGGVGGSLPTGEFPFQVEESEYDSILRKLGRVDVLISHEPPYDTNCDLKHGDRHIGSRAVREYILRERPSLVLVGHVHESAGIDRLGPSTVVNPGPFFRGNYAAAEMGGGDVRVTTVKVDSIRRGHMIRPSSYL